MNKLYISNKTKYNFKQKRLFKKIVKLVGKELRMNSKMELGLIIVNNKEIKKINQKYRNKNYATDILSFPQGAIEIHKQIGYYLLGDMYVSFEKIESQAKEFGHSSKREWAYIFTHGLLHLFGYDHIKKSEEEKMNALTDKIMKKIKVGR